MEKLRFNRRRARSPKKEESEIQKESGRGFFCTSPSLLVIGPKLKLPAFVFEYVSHGALSEILYDETDGPGGRVIKGALPGTWSDPYLAIAVDLCEALLCVHSTTVHVAR